MEDYNKLTKNNLPSNGQTVWLGGESISGFRSIKAKFFNDNGNLSFQWIREDFERGICTVSPTHWKEV